MTVAHFYPAPLPAPPDDPAR
eukprot:SAG25_NODE_888_length_4924_cov_17.004560_10_plen_20_part_01